MWVAFGAKVLRNELDYIPRINHRQFFQNGFAELKMIMVVEVIEHVLKHHRALMRQASKPVRPLPTHALFSSTTHCSKPLITSTRYHCVCATAVAVTA